MESYRNLDRVRGDVYGNNISAQIRESRLPYVVIKEPPLTLPHASQDLSSSVLTKLLYCKLARPCVVGERITLVVISGRGGDTQGHVSSQMRQKMVEKIDDNLPTSLSLHARHTGWYSN
ncbi:hypothetical protein J6590_095226 [Homalodisca vitripennis]|nr:hypothetical protein J6590_095226 [Homalodisca vitripennis]